MIHSAQIVTDGRVQPGGWVRFEGGRISATGTGSGWTAADIEVDARGCWLTPGFVDIHCHGGAGAAFDDGPESIREALDLHQSHGTTRAVVSLVTSAPDLLVPRLAEVAQLAARDARVLGSHLEGPFLSAAHRGAHDPALLCCPTAEDVEMLLAAADGTLRQVTLAPELRGGMEAVSSFAGAGVSVAVGHTDADYAQALEAFAMGASILTHAYNGMNGVHHRAPGPVAAATRTRGVFLEVINDGVHVHPEVVRMLFAAAPGRIALISDAMSAAGGEDGRYSLGGMDVDVCEGVARLAHGGSIAGSTLTLDKSLRLAVETAGIPIAEAVKALTFTPAAAIGLGHAHGRLARDYPADAVLLDSRLQVLEVWLDGRKTRDGTIGKAAGQAGQMSSATEQEHHNDRPSCTR